MRDYRQIHEDSLRENQPETYRELKKSGQLKAHLDAVGKRAKAQHEQNVKHLAERNPYHPVEWANNRGAWEGWLERTAEELVLADLLVPDAETQAAMRDGYTG